MAKKKQAEIKQQPLTMFELNKKYSTKDNNVEVVKENSLTTLKDKETGEVIGQQG